MKINPLYNNRYLKAATGPAPAQQTENRSEQPVSKLDSITISQQDGRHGPFAGLTREITDSAVATNSPARIQELREAILSGSYQVPAADVAAAMLEHSSID